MKRGRGSEIDRICICSHFCGGLTDLLDVSQAILTPVESVKINLLSSVAIQVSVLIFFSPMYIFLICTIPVCETILLADGTPNHAVGGALVNLPELTGRCPEGSAADLCSLLQASAKAVTDGSARVLSSVPHFGFGVPHRLIFPSHNSWENNLIIAIGRQDKTRWFKNLFVKNKISISSQFLFKQNFKGFPALKSWENK